MRLTGKAIKKRPAWGTGHAFCRVCKVWWAKRSHGWAQKDCPSCGAALDPNRPLPEANEEIRPGCFAQWRDPKDKPL
jgi:hypothetical protein